MSLSASFPREEILMSSPSNSTIAGKHKFTPTHPGVHTHCVRSEQRQLSLAQTKGDILLMETLVIIYILYYTNA